MGCASLTSLPTELFVFLFSQVDSLSEALNLRAVSTRLNNVFVDEGDTIARRLASKTLACPQEALQLLGDQDASPTSAPAPRAAVVARLLRNQRAAELAATRFEDAIVSHVRCPAFDTRKIYGTQPRPKQLTSTERVRFIRAYYQRQSLLCLEDRHWTTRLAQTNNMRHLYYLREMCMLPLEVNAQTSPAKGHWGVPPWGKPQPLQSRLQSAVWWRMDEISFAAFGREAEEVDYVYQKEDGYNGHVVLWDHWQESLQQLVCRWKPAELGKVATLERPDLWISE